MPKFLLHSVFAIAVSLTLSACSNEPKDTHPNQPATKRKAVFKQMLRTLEPLGMIVRNRQDYDRRAFLADARELKQLATQPWPYFTPGKRQE